MRWVLTLLLAAPATPLAPATKPPSSRDVGRLVNEAATIEDTLATARLLPLAGEETQHWETQDVHIARRRKSLTALLRRVTRWTVGGAAAEARRGVLANDDFRRCMHLLAEPGPAAAYAAARRDGVQQAEQREHRQTDDRHARARGQRLVRVEHAALWNDDAFQG